MGGRGGSSGFTGSTAATPQFGNNVLSPQDTSMALLMMHL